MVELPLRKPIMVGLVHTEQLLQLDEDLTPPDALDTWSDGRVELATPEPSFDFPDREDVIGPEHAGSRGWATDPDEWERQLATASDRHCLDNRRTVLLMISDGSVNTTTNIDFQIGGRIDNPIPFWDRLPNSPGYE